MPNGTEIKPIKTPEIFLINEDICLGFSTNLSLKKMKNRPTKNEKKAKNKTKAGVF